MPQYQSKEKGSQFVSSTDAFKVDLSYTYISYTALLDVPEENKTKRYLCNWDSKSPETAAVCEAMIHNMQKGATYSKEVINDSFSINTEIPRPQNITTNSSQINNANANTKTR